MDEGVLQESPDSYYFCAVKKFRLVRARRAASIAESVIATRSRARYTLSAESASATKVH